MAANVSSLSVIRLEARPRWWFLLYMRVACAYCRTVVDIMRAVRPDDPGIDAFVAAYMERRAEFLAEHGMRWNVAKAT